MDIIELEPGDTHELRRRILRDGTASNEVVWDGDDDPTTLHLGVRVDGELVAISSWMRRPCLHRPDDDSFQLRGMATDPAHRGSGVSSALLAAGLDRCVAVGATLVWARARVAALTFYERHGFEALGPEYIDSTTGLPHRDIALDLRAASNEG